VVENVVYQKVTLGLSYGKIKRELAACFGLAVSRGALQAIVSEVARCFGPAYQQLFQRVLTKVANLRQEFCPLSIDLYSYRNALIISMFDA
jgi:hypothetical protein